MPLLVLARGAAGGSVTVDDPSDTLHAGANECAVTGQSPCSLRDAITYANANAGPDEIVIEVSLVTVGPNPLPEIGTDFSILSGLGGSFPSSVVIDGSAAGSANGLVVSGNNVRFGVLTVRNFGGIGVKVTGSSGTFGAFSWGVPVQNGPLRLEGNAGGGFVVDGGSGNHLEYVIADSNGSDGIAFVNGASDNAFTGVLSSVAIRNAGIGVRVGSSAADVATLRNGAGCLLSYKNLGRAVDLGGDGATANDPLDADTGPNGLQNAPVVTTAYASDDIVRVTGALHAAPNALFTVRVFTSQAPHQTGAGEAETFLGSTTVTTDANGDAAFAVATDAFSSQVLPGDWATAAAINAAGNLSELSPPVLVLPPPRASFYTLPPCRVVDTREGTGTPLSPGASRSFAVAGTCGVPQEALAVAANVTVVNAAASGTLRLFASGAQVPLASVVSYRPGTRANNAIVSLFSIPSGSVSAYTDQTHHLVIDVGGYFR